MNRSEQIIRRDNNRRWESIVFDYLSSKGLINKQLTYKMRYHNGVKKLLPGYKHNSWRVIRKLGEYIEINKTHIGFKYAKQESSKPKTFYQSKEWRELRVKALLKYGRKCCLCGRTTEDNVSLHVDHIIPRSKNPRLELDINNLQILCEDCNLGKSNKYSSSWR